MVIDYGRLPIHRIMLRDAPRCEAFREGLEEVIKPGMKVLDVGSGSGLLSLLAARAGAEKVYGFEKSKIIHVARQLVAANGFEDRIELLEGPADELELPEKVDLVVSEFLGGMGIDEDMLAMVLRARDRWLAPGGLMMPHRLFVWIAPGWDERYHESVDLWRRNPYGVDLSLIAELQTKEMTGARNHIREEHLLARPALAWDIDLATFPADEAARPFTASLEFELEKAGRMNGLMGWFEAPLSEKIVLTNRPGAPDTHWGRYVFPLGETQDVEAGTEVRARIQFEHFEGGTSAIRWAIKVGDYEHRSEDTFYWTPPS